MISTLLWLSSPVLAATLPVDPASSSAYATISEAVEIAESGDIIDIAGGTYAECINPQGRSLTFRGPTTSPPAVVDGTGLCDATVVVESAEELTLERLSLANTGGRSLSFSGSTVRLDTVSITQSGAADVYGGAIWGTNGILETTDSTFTDNTGDEGGALYLYDAVSWTDTGSKFVGNTSARSGGAVFAYSNHTLTLDGTTFEDNGSGGHGGALYTSWYSSLTAEATTFTDNAAGWSGGAVFTYVVTGDLSFSESRFIGNQALDGWGGAIEVEWYSLLQVLGSHFEGNTATAAGGAISQWYETSGIVRDSSFARNSAVASGGAWYWNPYQGRADSLNLIASTFEDNASGSWGGAVYGSWADRFDIAESVFHRNTAAGNGGGIAIYTATGVTIHRSEFCGNDAALGGAAQIEWADTDRVTNTTFVDNLATRGAGLFRYASYSGSSEYNSFVGNIADTRGGAYVDEWGASSLDNTAFFHHAGGAIDTEFSGTAGSTSVQYNAWGDNEPVDGTGYFSVNYGTNGNVSGDPVFVAYTPGGPCAEQDLHPMAGSVLLDAANPADRDLDGSRADIGAWGGPDATLEDADEDGVLSDADCMDGDPSIHPGVDEVCDGIDNNCDGTIDGDDATDAGTWFEDADGDGYGDPSSALRGCGGSGWVAGAGDCDDTDAGIHPAATEQWYDGIDADCDGASDDDADGDGWDKPVGDNGGRDCDDTDATVHPTADDMPGDGIDQDCDGADDAAPEEATASTATLPSADGDGKVSGCATTGTRPVGLWALLLPLLVMGRRRSA